MRVCKYLFAITVTTVQAVEKNLMFVDSMKNNIG